MVSLTLSFGDIAELLEGETIEVTGNDDEAVSVKIRRYRTDPVGVDEVRDALEDNFDDDDLDDEDDDIEDPDDYIDEDEDEGEDDDEGEEDGPVEDEEKGE